MIFLTKKHKCLATLLTGIIGSIFLYNAGCHGQLGTYGDLIPSGIEEAQKEQITVVKYITQCPLATNNLGASTLNMLPSCDIMAAFNPKIMTGSDVQQIIAPFTKNLDEQIRKMIDQFSSFSSITTEIAACANIDTSILNPVEGEEKSSLQSFAIIAIAGEGYNYKESILHILGSNIPQELQGDINTMMDGNIHKINEESDLSIIVDKTLLAVGKTSLLESFKKGEYQTSSNNTAFMNLWNQTQAGTLKIASSLPFDKFPPDMVAGFKPLLSGVLDATPTNASLTFGFDADTRCTEVIGSFNDTETIRAIVSLGPNLKLDKLTEIVSKMFFESDDNPEVKPGEPEPEPEPQPEPPPKPEPEPAPEDNPKL